MSGEEVIYVNEDGQQVSAPTRDGAPTQGSYPPMSVRGDKGDILDKIKPDIIVETIRRKLMGQEFINGQWVTNEKLKGRATSESGAWDIANLMLGASSQNVALSKLTNEEVRARALSIAKTAQHLCLKNWKEYGINGVDQLEYIHQIIFTNTFITLKQPQDGGIRDLIKGTTTENRVVSSQDEKRGFWRRG